LDAAVTVDIPSISVLAREQTVWALRRDDQRLIFD
jgi:hypothetical protein